MVVFKLKLKAGRGDSRERAGDNGFLARLLMLIHWIA